MEKFLELYKYIDGVNDAPFPDIEEHLVIREFRYDAKRMGGAPTISFTAMHRLCLDNMWSKDVYATFNGERYYIKQTPTSSYSNSDTRYKHEVELVSERTVLDNVYFYDVVTKDTNVDKPVSNSSKFTFFGDINEYVTRLNYSLIWAKVDYTIVIDEGVSSEEKQVTFENQVVTNALQEIYNIYQIPYYFVGKTIHIGEYQDNIDHVFKYGVNNSLLSISKNNANAKIINRITGVGSQDNIPYYYPNDDEKGVTIPLLNGSTNGISISNQSRYKKVRLSDKFVFHKTIQTETPLINSSIYTLGDLVFDKKEEDKDAQYTVDFYYTFTLDQAEDVSFKVSMNDENTVDLIYEIYKTSGHHLGYFRGENKLSLTGGTYNLIIRWTFLNPEVLFGVEEQIESLISENLDISSYIIVNGEQVWTLKNIPISTLDSYGIRVDNPSDGDIITIQQLSYINPQPFLMPSIYRSQGGNERFYNAENDKYRDENGEYYVFENEYAKNHPSEHIENFDDIKPTIKNVTNAEGFRIDRFVDFAYDLYDNDEVDEEGKFIHKYFFAKLNKLDGENGFNLFDHSIDESEMIISMTSGSCGSCSFKVLVNKDNQKNTVQVDENGNLLRDSNGNVRFGSPQDRQNDTENYEVWIALEKDIDTFGVLMPNATNKYRPSSGDTFVILHIDLPKAYIEAAEKRLDDKLIKYMYDNNFEKFNFSIAFSRIFFAENPSILNSLNENSKITIEYNGREYSLYVSSISIAMTNEKPLPEIKVELNDNIAVSKNQISQIVESTKKDILSKTTKDVFWGDIKGIPSWIGSEKPRYSYSELSGAIFQESNTGGYWVLKNDKDNNPYIYTELPVVSKSGYVSYANIDDVELPNLYDGLPIDNQTLYWEEVKEEVGTDEEGNPIYETTKVLKAAGGGTGGGGVADSVHWNNIEGKPDFSQYATKDSLSGYLPLSGGTMTGQINMPVGIGKAIKFGEESRLFASNGNFYISAETHLIFASGASGNNVPNNVVINKDGRMFIANNLAVGHASFIMDSYKLNVAGDAYVNGKLVVNGTIYPSISSLFNIGDPSKRFACIHADSVDVGGVKISLLQDGVLLIDGNLAVTGGITSYVDGGELDLPSIYDGLPIDGNTLYWVLDENGKKVMLKSKGGDEEGGGSVKSPLSWSGFSNGSWNGSEAKTIVIPSKLSELDNDGKFFADGGWIGSDANSVIFGSYLYGGYSNNTPRNVGQLLAFNNGDLESWNRGSQIFIEGENFYYRQFWDNSWKNWRRVISENADGVIDYDLTLGGSLNMPSGYSQVKCGEKNLLECYSGTNTYLHGEDYLYLESKALYTILDGEVYGILHEGNYKNYEYPVKKLSVTDIRNTTPKPSDIDAYAVSAQFANTDNPGDGWYSGLSIQGWTNDYKAWQLRSGAWGFASDHLYFRNGVLETWNDWRRVITGDVDGAIDFSLKMKDDITFDFNPNRPISKDKNPTYGISFRGEYCKIYSDETDHLTIRAVDGIYLATNDEYTLDYRGGGFTINGGLITYNESKGYFQLDGNLLVTGGITAFADSGAGNQWIMDVNSLEEVVSDNPFKVYSAKVVSMIASNITNMKEVEDGVKEALDKLEIIEEKLSGITLASAGANVRDVLMFIYRDLRDYVRDTE